MVRRSPAEYYIKYLILTNYTDQSIRDLFSEIGLDWVSNNYLRRVRIALDPPTPFFPRDLRHKASQRFLLREKIYDIFQNSWETRAAFDILENARAKEFIETMLLVSGPPLAIASALSNRYRISGCTVGVVNKYSHYFFNMGLVDSTEARALLQLRTDRLTSHPDETVSDQSTAFKKSSYTDARMAAARLPHSPISALIAQVQMGFMPKSIPIRELMDVSENMANLRLAEALFSNGADYDRRALNLATTMKILQEIRENKVRPEEELRQQLDNISLKTEMNPVPLVHDLTGGQHTTDLAALPEAKERHGTKK